MKKTFLFTIALFSFIIGKNVKADEGMWLPMFVERLNYVDMQKQGLKLTAEELYSINHSSLKDAIIQFGNGCTGEIISKEGLVLTNHHCGFGQIQSHSTVENDILTKGFWAMNKNEELANPGLTATFLVKMDDVTKQVLADVTPTMTEKERATKIEETIKKIKAETEKGTHYTVSIRSFFDGNEYYLFVYEVFKDVRLVGTPPYSIGKFGADADNWMWPRHTGDFSMFRVYTAPDGKPAEYSKDNVPMKPKHHLPVSLKGYEKNDYAMIMGYPGTTDRFLTSYGIQVALDVTNPAVVKIREKKLALMKEDMDASDAVRIQYASKYAGIANYWKYFIGQSKGLKRLKVYDKKLQIENDFSAWVSADNSRKEKYGEAISLISNSYNDIKKYALSRTFYGEALLRGSELVSLAGRMEGIYKELKSDKPDMEKVKKNVERIKSGLDVFYKDFNIGTDKKILAAMFEMASKDMVVDQQPSILIDMNKKFKGDFGKYAEMVFAKSLFTDKAKVLAFLENPQAKMLDKDPAFVAFISISKKFDEIFTPLKDTYSNLNKGNRLFVAGIREMNPDKKYAPNANSTMRLTYGSVLDYKAADAVHFKHFTTIEGIMEKEDPKNDDFIVPAKLKELYLKKDYGQYADKDGVMRVAFITNNDITGGNSGSPVINGNGELIGLAFDGNWEAMSGNIAFEPELQRTINVDIRYVLFIIDKYAGATNLINEMTIVK